MTRIPPNKPPAKILPFRRPPPAKKVVPEQPTVMLDGGKPLLPQISRILFMDTRTLTEKPADKAQRLRAQCSIRDLVKSPGWWVRNMADIERDDRVMGVDERVAIIIDDMIIASSHDDLAEGMCRLRCATARSANAYRFLAEFVRRGCDEARVEIGMIGEEAMYVAIAQYAHLYGIAYAMGEIYGVVSSRRAVQRTDCEDDELGMTAHDRLVRLYRQRCALEIYKPLEESERTPGAKIIPLPRT